jgi:hypothetical protein
MLPEFLDLIHREHAELEQHLALLTLPSTESGQLRASLDAVVLGLTAHAEAELIALQPFCCVTPLQTLIAEIDAEHLAQEGALSALICAPLGTPCSRERAETLSELVHQHAVKEERYLPAAIRMHAGPEAYAMLAGTYATERLRQLAMLHTDGENEELRSDL